MSGVLRAKLIADLDMEPIVSAILRWGMYVSVCLILIGLIWYWATTGQLSMSSTLQGTNVFHFLMSDVRQVSFSGVRPQTLIDVGLAVLLLTPYVRVFASMVYFGWVECSRLYTVLTVGVFLTLTYILFLG